MSEKNNISRTSIFRAFFKTLASNVEVENESFNDDELKELKSISEKRVSELEEQLHADTSKKPTRTRSVSHRLEVPAKKSSKTTSKEIDEMER